MRNFMEKKFKNKATGPPTRRAPPKGCTEFPIRINLKMKISHQ